MGQCKAYTHQVNQGSPQHVLLDAIRKSGVPDSELDIGFHQIDYHRPGEQGRTEGAGDCLIDPREVERHVIERWREFKEPIKQWLGHGIPWDYDETTLEDTLPSGVIQKTTFRAFVQRALEAVEKDLKVKGIASGSDTWHLTVAKALYYFVEFPCRSKWLVYDRRQRGEILEKINRLDEIGLKHFKKFLTSNGGFGNFYDTGALRDRSPGSSNWKFLSNVPPFLLYAVMEMAGLKPSFVELTGLNKGRFTCDDEGLVRFGVGIETPLGLRVFDPSLHNADVTDEVFYPLTLRQVIAGMRANRNFTELVVSRKGNTPDARQEVSADGAMVLYGMFTAMMVRFSRQSPDFNSAEGFFSELVKTALSQPKMQHPRFLEMLYFGASQAVGAKPDDVDSLFDLMGRHPALPPKGPLDYLWILEHSGEEDSFDPKEMAERTSRLLILDPTCFGVHYTLAKQATLGKIQLEGSEIERHFIQAVSTILPDCEMAIKVNYYWGIYLLKMGRVDEAMEKFRAVWEGKAGNKEFKARSAILLSFNNAAHGNTQRASKLMGGARDIIIEQLKNKSGPEDALDWLAWFETQGKKGFFGASVLKDAQFARLVCQTVLPVFSNLLINRRFTEATKAASIIVAMSPLGLKHSTLSILQEAHLQAGDIKAAEDDWRRIWEIVTRGEVSQ